MTSLRQSTDATTNTPATGEWRTARLGDICNVQLGKMLSPASKTGTESFPYLRNANVQWRGFDLSDVAEMDFSEAEREKFALRAGDLLVCEGGEPGRAAIWDGSISPCFYQKALHRLRPLDTSTDPRIIMYRLRLGALTSEFTESHAKTTIAHLPAVRLNALRVSLPSPSEQARLADILDDQMALINRARAAVEQQLQAATTLAPAYLRAAFESDDAKAWPSTTLADVLALRKDVVHPYDSPIGPATFVGLEHIESHTGVRAGSVGVEMSLLTGRKPQFFVGDIVYGYLRPYLNKVWLADFDGLCSVDQYVFKVRERAVPEFVAWFMRSPTYLQRAPIDTSPGQLPRIRTEEVFSVEFGLPAPAEQRRVADDIAGMMRSSAKVVAGVEEQRRALDTLEEASLRAAFRGET